MTEADFQEKLLFTLIRAKRAQNVTNMEFFLRFHKFCHYFLLEVNKMKDIINNMSFTVQNPISEKILIHEL